MTLGSLDTLVLERPDGADYTLRFGPGSVAVEYLGTEISDYLQRGFAPLKGESVADIDARIEGVLSERKKLLDSGRWQPVPYTARQTMRSTYSSEVCDYVVTRHEPLVTLLGARALCSGSHTKPTKIYAGKKTLEDEIWEHELLHASMRDNTTGEGPRWLDWLDWPLCILDMLPLPMVYSPGDSHTALFEAVPPAFGVLPQECNSETAWLGMYAAAPVLNITPLMSMPTTVTLLTGLLTGHFNPVFQATLASMLLRVPRSILLGKALFEDYGMIRDILARVGEAESLKLLACLDRKMLRKTESFMDERDISF